MEYKLDSKVYYKGQEATVYDYSHRFKTYTLQAAAGEMAGKRIYDVLEKEISIASPEEQQTLEKRIEELEEQNEFLNKRILEQHAEMQTAGVKPKLTWQFEHKGFDKDGTEYFCFITDDHTNRGQGLSKCWNYYSRNQENRYKHESYLTFLGMPPLKPATMAEASDLLRRATSFFNGLVPYSMEILEEELQK